MRRQWDNDLTNEYRKSGQPSSHGFFEKVLGIFGFEAEDVIEEESAAGLEEYGKKEPRERGKLLSLANAGKAVKMIIIEPSGFDEVQTIVDHLKNKQTVILNLEETDKVIARRIADFIGGAIYALDGSMQKVSGAIFLFTPANVEVTLPPRTGFNEKERETERTNLSASLSSSLFRNDRDLRRD